MARNRGGYNGGSTSISGRDAEWFSKGSTEKPMTDPVVVGMKRSPEEQRLFEAMKREALAPKTTLIKLADYKAKGTPK